MIQDKNTSNEIMNLAEFAPFAGKIFPKIQGDYTNVGEMRLEELKTMWPIDGIAEGLEYMRELREKGERIFYSLDGSSDESERYFFHFPVAHKAPFVIIVPGGGYHIVCSFIEGYPVEKQINKLGYHAFVVNYGVGEHAAAPGPMEDLVAAIRYIFEHQEELNIDASHYMVAGFSAGGHLAATYGTEKWGCSKYQLPQPDVMTLAYPVVTMGKYTHEDSRNALAGINCTDMDTFIQDYSLENLITDTYPPCYIWQCSHDNTVPVQNSQMLVAALKKQGVPYRYKTYDSDAHGWGAAQGTIAQGWLKEAIAFWRKNM